MSDYPAAVAEFFDSYRRAFERFDSEAVTGHFAFPLQLASDADAVIVRSVATREDWMPQLDRLLGTYRTLGVRSAQLVDHSATRLSEHLVLATARWALADAERRLLYQFSAAYTLAAIDGVFRIVALAHDELPQIQAALARR